MRAGAERNHGVSIWVAVVKEQQSRGSSQGAAAQGAADLVHEVARQVEVVVDRRIARALAELRAQPLRQCTQARLGA